MFRSPGPHPCALWPCRAPSLVPWQPPLFRPRRPPLAPMLAAGIGRGMDPSSSHVLIVEPSSSSRAHRRRGPPHPVSLPSSSDTHAESPTAAPRPHPCALQAVSRTPPLPPCTPLPLPPCAPPAARRQIRSRTAAGRKGESKGKGKGRERG